MVIEGAVVDSTQDGKRHQELRLNCATLAVQHHNPMTGPLNPTDSQQLLQTAADIYQFVCSGMTPIEASAAAATAATPEGDDEDDD